MPRKRSFASSTDIRRLPSSHQASRPKSALTSDCATASTAHVRSNAAEQFANLVDILVVASECLLEVFDSLGVGGSC